MVVCTVTVEWAFATTCFHDAGMPLFDHYTHFHIPIWLAFRGITTPVCRRGIPMGPRPLETDLQVLNVDGRL